MPKALVFLVGTMTLVPAAQPRGAVLASAVSDSRADLAAELEPLVRAVMNTGLTPGLSVAVVRGDRIVWAAGFGDADREQHRPVTTDTRFYIASTTKALTALAIARLAQRGRISLDAPITRLLPGAQLAPELEPETITLRRLLTHTHGIDPQGPVSLRVTFTGDYTNADLLAALAGHRPARNGRAYTYSNLGYELAAMAIAAGQARGWRDVIEREVLNPLGMKATTALVSRVPADKRAEPYETGATGVERIPLRKHDGNMGPAGGYFSTAPDLSRLVIAEMNGGRLDGRQRIEAAAIAETQRKHVENMQTFGPFERQAWGLGWDIGTYSGEALIHRFGVFDGYRSHVSFMPSRRLGVVILLNGGAAASPASDALAAAIYDHLIGRASAQAVLLDRLTGVVAGAERTRNAIVADLARRNARPKVPKRSLESYAGTFAHPHYGTVVISVTNGALKAKMGVAESAMEVFDLDKEIFRVDFIGTGWTIGARFPPGASHPDAVRLLDADFVRK